MVFGLHAAARARSRVSQGSTGPSPASSPGRSARRDKVASGAVRVTRLANPRAPRRAGAGGLVLAGAGVLAQEQVQVGAGAQLVRAALQPGGSAAAPRR